ESARFLGLNVAQGARRITGSHERAPQRPAEIQRSCRAASQLKLIVAGGFAQLAEAAAPAKELEVVFAPDLILVAVVYDRRAAGGDKSAAEGPMQRAIADLVPAAAQGHPRQHRPLRIRDSGKSQSAVCDFALADQFAVELGADRGKAEIAAEAEVARACRRGRIVGMFFHVKRFHFK